MLGGWEGGGGEGVRGRAGNMAICRQEGLTGPMLMQCVNWSQL